MEITKREVILSITVMAIMLIIGVLISSSISNTILDNNAKYDRAKQIESTNLFKHCMNTNAGDAFVYGKLSTIDPVTYPEIGKEYMYVEKTKEVYTAHVRTISQTDSKGHTYFTTEVYHTWDDDWTHSICCHKVNFCGVDFSMSKFQVPEDSYITTIYDKSDSDIRYEYHGTGTDFIGTIYTCLKNNTISNNNSLYIGMNVKDTISYVENDQTDLMFWIFWIILIIIMVGLFYCANNNWLNK